MKILLIGTGGTLVSSESVKGLKPNLDLKVVFDYLPAQIQEDDQIDTISAFNIDSSDMNCFYIVKLANIIYNQYNDYDGFLIIHGTDTMAYTSATLHYMFENLKKPIVFTGSQFPIQTVGSDARNNILQSIDFIKEQMAGVFVVFDGKIIFGERAYKKRSQSINAFVSLNVPCLGEFQNNKIQYNQILNRKIDSPFFFRNSLEEKVLLIKLYPSISKTTFKENAKEYKGVIVEGFGVGNVPTDISDVIKKLIEQDKLVIITTQCLLEGVVPNRYAIGNIHEDILYLDNLHSEAILAKCRVGFGFCKTKEEMKNYMLTEKSSI